jgi:exopolyphosphatase/pppGpp-phosphohydrolase
MSKLGMDGRRISRLSVLREWVFRQLGSVLHERRVAGIAKSLVQITRPLHDLDCADIRLLRMAAIVHDVGRSINVKRHPTEGARLIRRENSLPLKKPQRRALAFLTLRHRGSVPGIGQDPALRQGDDAYKLRMILAFLRAADALDSRSLSAPRIFISRRGRRLRIVCRLREDSRKARRIFSRRKKFRLLEEMLDCKIDVAIESGRRLRAVA